MKNKELGPLLNSLDKVLKLGNARFSYAVTKNMKMISEELEIIQKSIEQSEEYKVYDKLRIELCEKYAEKDENGQAKIIGNTYVFKKNKKKFDDEIKVLQEENKVTIEEHNAKILELDKLLEEETDLKFFEIKYDILPDDIRDLLYPIFELVEKIEQ